MNVKFETASVLNVCKLYK